MKIRSLKLKEAHKSNGGSSFCSAAWDLDGRHLVTASASDPAISIHDLTQQNPKPSKTLRHHKVGVTAIALSPNCTCLASGSLDHSVKLYKFPSGDFQHNVTRFTLPIRALAFNKSGSLLAAAGDDEGIKLIAKVDGSISRVLKGHKGPVTCLAFDPNNEYLASTDGMGTVIYWELSSGKPLHTLKGIAPDSGYDDSVLNIVSWSPDGEMLAVPGLRNDVVMYDRDTAEKLFSLKGDHIQAVCFLSWAPNGKYLATSGLDKQVLIWDIDLRQDMDRQKFDERVCCLSWKPNGNALAVIDVMGRYGVWESVIPSSMKSPTEGASNLLSRNSNGLLLFDEDDQAPSDSGSLSDSDDDDHKEVASARGKRLRKQYSFSDKSDEECDKQDNSLPRTKLRKKAFDKLEESFSDGKPEQRKVDAMKFVKPRMQEPFQPGSTPMQSGKKRFLCYNMLGSITSIENDGYSHIEVDFHDTGRGPRVPSMTDYFGFTMAALNEHGSVFANPCKGDKNMSTLLYRPFASWANNSEWSMRLEAEEVKAVALGAGWIAAVTSLNFLRIFTEGGLQKYILSIDGPVVTAVGYKDELAVVIHCSDCLPSGDQMLDFIVFNINKGTKSIKGRLPLTPTSSLTWLGYSEEGHLSSYDSKGTLRVFTDQYGGSWLPIFSSSKARTSDEENYWVVGLNASKLFCVTCKFPDLFPPVTPKPVLSLLSLALPLASSDLGADELENEFIMTNLYLSQTQNNIEEMAASGLDTTALDDEAFNLEAALDRCILRLIASCCNGDKLVRAVELARLLSLEKSLKGAIKLVTALKLPVLAERFNSMLEERLQSAAQFSNSVPTIANGVGAGAMTHVAESVRAWAPSCPSPLPKLQPPQFSESSKPEVVAKSVDVRPNVEGHVGSVKDEKVNQSTGSFGKLSKSIEKSEEKPKRKEEILRDGKLSKNGEKAEEKPKRKEEIPRDGKVNSGTLKEDNKMQLQRPTNPFAKTSNNQEKLTLLDSLKKMKRADEGKEKAGGNKR